MLALLLAALPLQVVAQTPPVSITADQNLYGVDEGETATFTVKKREGISEALTVVYATSDGGGPLSTDLDDAKEGTDYTAVSGSHTFPAGKSEPLRISVVTKEDSDYEPREYFKVEVSGSYQVGGQPTSFSVSDEVRIDEDDERNLALSPISKSALASSPPEFMAKEGGKNDDDKNELTITLNDLLPYDLEIPYTVGFSPHTTAATFADFTMAGGKVTIPEGQTSVTIDVGIIDDNRVEPTEYFTLQLGAPTYDRNFNFAATYNEVKFQDGRVAGGTPLSVSIIDNDTQQTGGVVYLRGEGPNGLGIIDKFPNTRRTLTEGASVTITAEIAGAAPTSDIKIPLKFAHFPSGEATPADYEIPTSIPIMMGTKSGSVTLKITDDSDDERYRELLVVEIDDSDMMNFPAGYTKGDRSKYEVVMLDNDKTPVNLLMPSATALTEAAGGRTATFELSIERRPKADPEGTPPFTGTDAETKEGDAKLILRYTGKAARGTDYKLAPNFDNGIVIRKSPAQPPSSCSLKGETVTCTVTLTVEDDNLYEGGAGTKENVRIDLNTGASSFTGGISTPKGLNLTIEDDDPQPMFSIADMSGPENGNLTFTVEREGARGNNVSVTAGTGSHSGATNSAIADTDYTTKSQKLDFGRGNTTQTFVVTITEDNIDEHNETFAVTLSNPVDNQGLPKPKIKTDGKTAVGTIEDNDDAPTLLTISVDTDARTGGDQNTIAEAADETTVSVTATIDSPTRFATDQTVTVTVGKEGDKAVEGTDYAEVANTIEITIPATEKSGAGTFELTPVNDDIDDDGEMISVEGALAGMKVTHATITIVDDDERGITVEPVTLTLNEADDTSTEVKENEGTYEVVLKSKPTGTVTVGFTNPGPTVATVDPFSLTFTATNWDAAQTVTVIAKDDTIDDTGNEKTTTISHTVSADGTDYEDEEAGDVAVTVLDDDGAPMALTITLDTDTDTADNQGTISEGADNPTVWITATLDGDTQFATDQIITIIVGDSEKDSATEGDGGDYSTVNDFNITLPAKATSVSHDLTLTLNPDGVDESDETVTVAGELAGLTVTDTMFTIEDNDATPTVTLVLTPASINESGATNASTVTATMNGESSEAVTLTVSSTPVSPAVAGDLTLSDNKTLTIPANTQASTGVVTITAVDNDVDAANKTVTVAATATGGNALVQAPGNQTLTITDDDTRGITVSKATLTLDEEDNTATTDADEHEDTYTVVLDSEPSGGTVAIGVASGDTNIAGVAPETLTFTASNWDEAQTVTVASVLDGIDNPNDRRTATITHTVTATGTDYNNATASDVTVTVNDDDGAPTLSINSPSVTEVDGTATATLTFTVRLTPASGNTVTVDYADTDTGTATSGGTDYATLASGTLTFAAGETSKTVEVTVSGDDIDELDESVVVRLSSPSNATLTGGATTLDGTGTITDNDPTPTVSVADAAAVSEGDVAAPDPPNNMTFAVTLSADSGLGVTVPYTLSGTATAGTDYTEPDPRSVTITAGMTQASITIPVAGDEVDEENETITVTLGTPTNATVSTAEGAGVASGTITDDDTRGVSVTPTTLTLAEADNTGTADTREDQETYKVVLTSQPTGAVTVNLKSGDESVARINTASLVFDADDWNTERTVTVTGQADVIDNTGDERATTISHTVSAAGTDYEDEIAMNVAVTVTDDDAAPSGITLTASPDSVTENGGAKTITVTAAVNDATRYADANTVTVSVGGGTAISGTDYSAVESFDITIGAGEDDASNTFTLTPTNDVLAEGNETIDVTGTLSGITITPDAITLTDDDAAPSGITLTVDTNAAGDGTPSTVAEDAGATVVTVTATVNGETRYVEAKTVAVSVAGGTAASPADYAAVSGFNITIAAGAASQTGSFTVTPVDDDLDESNETINVTGTLNSVTITGATVTLTDNDDPVSFSIAAAEATEGGKVTFTVSRAGAEDNVASVKIATATDSGDGANAADADDYTAIATAQTLNFAKGATSQTVEVQTTQDDLFEPDETFKAVLSDPALADGDPGTGVSIESGKGTAIGTIKNDDTQPSFAVANASASEGNDITFTVTRSGAMDNAVSVKWNTKADSSDGANAASTTDYTPVTAAQTLSFAKGVGTQTFTVATTEDALDEENETFLVELTGAVGGTIATAQATGTITDDDAAPTGITLSVDTNGSTAGTPSTVAEDAGATVVTVTATVNGETRYVEAKTVAVSVAGGTAASPADYAAVSGFNITIAAGAASQTGSFTVTPVDDDLDESNETIDVTGTLTDITITGATVTFTDNDDPVSFSIAAAEATEGGKVTFTVSRAGAGDNVASVKVATAADSGDGVKAADADDYTAIATAQTLNFAKGATSQTVEVQTTQDDLFEPDETFKAVLSDPALADGDPGTGVSIESGKGTAIGTIKNDDTQPSFAVANASASEGNDITFTVTRSGAMDNAVSVKWNTKVDSSDGANAASTTDYTPVTAAQTLSFAKGVSRQTFTVATTEDNLDEDDETFLVELTGAVGATIATAQATGTITDDDAAPGGITLSVDTNGSTAGTPSTVAEDAGATVVTVTATVNGETRYVEAKTVAVSVADDTAASPADYAAVNNFNITIAAGAASQTGSFTVTPVDDDLDESNETIDVTGTLTDITITGTTVTLTDTDDPVSFSIADAEATEGGKVTFTVSRKGAGDNVASVKVTTATDSGDDANAADADDYTAIATAQTLNFAKGVTSQMVEVQTTQDDLFESDETFKAVLSDPALGDGDPGTGVSIESGKGMATGTIRNDDTEPSFAVADASASEGDAITFTVTRSGAMDNAVSVKWNTKADSSDGANAASATDYTPVTTATTLTFVKGVDTQTFTVSTTEDALDEENETFLVELTAAEGGTISDAEATGTITDDDAAPGGITLSVDTNGSTSGTPDTVAEDAGATVVTVTATVNGTTRYVEAQTVAVSVADDTAASPADYAAVNNFNITIAAGAASHTGNFTVTPVDDDLDESNETINVTGTLSSVTITGATVTLTDNDDPVSFSIADAEATEGGKVTFTVSRAGAEDNVASVKVATAADSGDGVKAADADDYTAIATAQTLNFAKGATSQTVEVQTTQDDLFEPDETFKAVLSDPALADGDPGTGVSIESGKGTAIGTIKNDDTQPSFAVANASASEGNDITFTVTRSGAMDNAVSVKWNTKADSSDGANAASTTDYTPVTAAQTLSFAKGVGTQTFTVATTEDALDEENETFLVELTGAVGGTIATAQATGTITDDDAAPTGITLSVDTNGSTAGTPSTVAEDAGATVVTVTATVNGETRYVEAKTVAVSVAGGTAASPADYAAVSGFNITIAAGAASQTGSFTVTPVDDDLDESNETIDVTGTLTDITITGATVTFTDNDDPVSFSIAAAEATEGGKVTFTVSRAGAGDNVASVKVATAADSGDGVKAADADDYTAIATAQTLNFAKGATSQTVEVQTTQDDLFEPDETFKAVLSDPALADGDPGTGVSIESGKGTAIGTIKNDDTQPSFAVANASASEGNDITFTVTRSGAMDNAVSVKWNTKVDSSDGANAASTTDYTPVTAAQTLSFAKGVSRQTFTVATTEDNLDEDDETFLVELTGAVGATIATAQATGTITDDDAAPGGITLSVDTNGSTAGTPSTVAEDAGATVVTVTATVNGETRYVEAKTVAVSVADDTAASPADYAAVNNFNITIAAGAASQTGSFTVTPVDDDLDESNETIDVTGTLTDITITGTTVTLTDTDDPVSFSIADAEATEGGKVTFTVSRKGAGDNVASVKVTTATDSGDDANAADADDYTAIATAQTLNFAKGVTSQMVEVQTTQDDLFESDETFKAVLSDPALGDGDPGTGVSIESGKGMATGTIRNDDTEPSFAVADASASEGDAITFTVTRSGAMDNAVSVKWNTKADSSDGANAASTTDYTPVTAAQTLSFAKGVGTQTFTVATTEDTLHEGNETFLVELTVAEGGTISDAEATGTITDDDAAPTALTLTVDADTGTNNVQTSLAEDGGAKMVRVTATLGGSSTFTEAKTVTVEVGADADSAEEGTDYTNVGTQSITINAGSLSGYVDFTLTPTRDVLHEGSETISLAGTLTGVAVTDASITLTDNDAAPTGITLSVAPTTIGEGADETEITVTATVNGTTRYVDAKTVTVSVGGGTAISGTDYDAVSNFDIIIAAGDASKTGTFDLTPTDDNLHEGSETIDVTGISGGLTITKASITLRDDDGQPSFAVADASADEGETITFTVTRSGATDNAVSVKWNTKAATGNGAASTSDYTAMTTATKLDFASGVSSQTFTVATTEDNLHEGNETFLVELTEPVGAIISDAQATGTITDDDAAPTGITLSVDTNGSTSGTPSTVAEDAGATVVTVTATVNGTTRYVDAKTVMITVADGTAASPADYAAVNNFNIMIAAGAASQTGSFTVTPVDDDLDESNETINVMGTLSSVTITGATVTLTDTNDPVSFSIADAEATEGGKVTFTVSRKGAGDNVASVKVATAADSGDGVKAADADDYTVIATAQTLNFAKGVTSQMVGIQTTQDDLFEPDETFRAVLSEPALGQNDPGTGVSIESSKGTATGTIKNDDTEPSFAVADASASEGDAITFTVTRSGAMDNAVSVKWNTKADSSDGANAASATDYTPVTAAQTLSFAKGVGTQTFTVSTTEDALDEGNETFLVELTGAVGGTITTAQATGTITDDDAAPTGITLSVDTNGSTSGTPDTVAEDAGATVVTVTATVNGTTRYVEAQTVAVSVADDTAASPADYAAVNNFNITIAAGAASHTGNFTVTPVDDDLDESNETINVTGTLSSVTITGATVTFTDNDDPVSFSIADAEATEGGKVTFTVSRAGAEDNVASVKIATAADSGDGVNAASTSDYTVIATAQTLNFAKDITSQTVEVQTTQDDLFEPDETFKAVLSDPALADGDPGTGVSIESGKGTAIGTIKNDDTQPSFAVANASASEGNDITFTVTRSGAMDNAVSVKWNTKADSSDGANAASTTDYTPVTAAQTLSFAKGVGTQTFTVATTEDTLHEGNETFLVELTVAEGGTISDAEATGTITDDDAAPTALTLTVDADTGTNNVQTSLAEDGGAKMVRVTATLGGSSTFTEAKTVTVEVGADADSAEEGTDYTNVGTQSITINAGSLSGYVDFTLTPTRDVLHEGSETISLAGTLTGVAVTDASITLTDNDAAPTGITLSVAPTTIGEGADETEITVTATVNGTTRYVDAKTVTVSVGGGTAISGTDYDAVSNFDIIIAAGDASKTGTFDLTPTDDNLHEGSETIDVTGISGGLTITKASITLRDDDGQPSFAVADASADEGETITFTVTRSGATDNAVSVKWNTKAATGNGAASTSDYTAMTTATKLDFASGVSSQTFTVATTEDNLHEGNETFLVELTEPVGAIISDAQATGTITDDDAAPTALTLSVDADTGTNNVQTSLAEDDGAKMVRVTATLSGSSTFTEAKTVTVEVGVDADSAEEGTDYANVGTRSITINAGALSGYVDFPLTPTNDDIDEPNEGVSIEGTLTGVTITGTSLTITDDDATPTATLVLTPTTINESGTTNVSTVTVTLSGESSAAVTVEVSVPNTAPVTLSNNTTLTITAGAKTSTGSVTITAVDNDVDAPNASVVVSGAAAGGGVANPTDQTLTITDDEGTPTVTLVLTPGTINETGATNSSTVTATLSGKSNTAVTLTVAAAAGADTAAGDFTLSAATSLMIAAGATTSTGTVTITAVDNDIDAPNKAVTVSATAGGGGVANPTNQTLTITDDEDVPTVTLVLDPTTINESGDGNSSTVTATLSGKSSAAVTVTVSVPNDAPVTLSTNATLSIAAGATSSTGAVTITAADNDVDAANASVLVSGVAAGGGVSNPGSQTLTITDDEGTPTVSLVLTPTTINESGATNTSTVTATLSGESSTAVTLTVAAVAGASTAAGDFTLSANKTLTIAAGVKASTGAVTITAVNNNIYAPNKTVTVSATASGGSVADPTNQTLTITDDDAAPSGITLTVSPAMVGEEDGKTEITVTATVNGTTRYANAKTVTVSVGGGTAISGTDYDAVSNFDIIIAAGDASKAGTFDLTPTDDVLDETNETINVSGTSGSLTITPATITITDDDDEPGAITISVDTDTGTVGTQTTIAEDGGAKTVRVTATITDETRFVEAKTVTVEVGKSSDSATEGTDYTNVVTQSITINAEAASGYVEFLLTPTPDMVHEEDETISLDGMLTGVTVTDATIKLTNVAVPPTGITLSVSPATVGEEDGVTRITVTATVTAAVNGSTSYADAKTVTVSVGDGTATSGTDYNAVSNFEIIIDAGQVSKAGTFDLTPTQDNLHEGSERIDVTGTSSGVPSITKASITLEDDDIQPSFAVADASASEGDAITFTVTRSGAMDNAVSVKWNTKAASGAGAATASDYTRVTTAQTLTFAKGVSSRTFTVATTEDTLHEGNETFLVELTAAEGATISDAEATGTITDDDAAPTALTLSVDADTGTNNVQTSLAEDGGAKMVRVTATLGGSSTFTEAKTVTVEVGADTDGATKGTDYTTVAQQSITINAGSSSGYVDFTITPTDDDIDEPNEGISIEGKLSSVTVTGTSLTLTDDEDVPTVTLVLTPTTINESGATNASTVTALLSGKSSAAVTVEVSVPNTAPVTLSSNTILTIAAGAKTSTGTVTITAVDNNVDAPNETVTVSAAAIGGVAIPVIETLTINDDDVAPTGITLSVSPATIRETDGETEITVTATVNGTTRYADAKTVTVSVGDGTATSGMDYDAVSNFDIIIVAGDTSNTGTFDLTIINDAVQEKDETIEITGSSGALNITKAMITITNSDPMPAAWLGRFGRTVAEQALDGIAGRIAASRSAGVQGSIAGHALNFDSPYSGSEALPRLDPRAGAGGTGVESITTNDTTTLNNLVNNNVLERSELTLTSGDSGIDAFDTDGQTSRSYTMTARELLLGSSFTATGEKDVSGGSLASWGRTAQSSFDGREGTLSLDGEATTTMLGVDYARDHWLVGMALMQSNGKGGYQDSETELRAASPACSTTENGTEQGTCNRAVRDGEGEVEATLTAVTPYAAIQTSENLKLWGTLGHGTGEVTLTPAVGDPLKADISWTMAAVGLRSDIIVPRKNSTELGPLSDSGLALALTADALWARTSSNRTQDMVASDSDVTRLRFGLEGSYQITLKQGGSVTPRLEVGVRQDGGSAETGLGIELVGGLSWLDPTLGLSIDLSGRTLIVHSSDDLKNQSFAVAFAWDPDPATQRGPSLKFSQQWGTIALGGLDTPFGPDSIEDLGDSENTARWQADAAWGFPIFGGTFTGSPHVGVGLASDTRDYSLGWRLTPAANANAPDLSFAVKATRQESDTAPPEHSIGFVLIFRW